MLRQRLVYSSLALGVALGGCARTLDEGFNPEDRPNPDNVVVAQFDPTNPIPALQLTPTPTALAQLVDEQGNLLPDLNKEQIAPDECERPTAAQCLTLPQVAGWPTTTPVTLYFSGEIDASSLDTDSVMPGIRLFEVGGPLGATPVPYTFAQAPRPAPNEGCSSAAVNSAGTTDPVFGLPVGVNGSAPAIGYQDADIPPGNVVILTPNRPLKPLTQYFVLVESFDAGGLRDTSGNKLEPSDLFFLLNQDQANAPVVASGEIPSALLQAQVVGSALASICRKRIACADAANQDADACMGEPTECTVTNDDGSQTLTNADLTEREAMAFAAIVGGSGQSLFGLYNFFDQLITTVTTAGLVENRSNLILANVWSTGPDGGPELSFDPAPADGGAPVLPFPNSQLLTATSSGARQVTLPLPPEGDSSRALFLGLNTLNGFSNTAPISIPVSASVDQASLANAIFMYPVDENGMVPAGSMPVPLDISTSSASADTLGSIVLRPVFPLQQNQEYVIGVTNDLMTTDGESFGANSTFSLLKTPFPFIDAMGTVDPRIFPVLQCGALGPDGSFPNDAQVQGLAALLETSLNHSDFLRAFAALESAPTPLPRENVAMAFSYHTQDITGTVDAVKNALLPNVWEQLDGRPRVSGPLVELTGSSTIAQFIDVVGNLCVPICQQGATSLMPNECLVDDGMGGMAPNPQLPQEVVCQLAVSIVAGQLDRAALYVMKGYRSTVGNPYVAGNFTPQSIMQPEVIDIPFWVINSGGPAPAEGFPVAIFQHGLGQTKETGFFIANSLAGVNTEGGRATILMDLPFHGSRASDIVDNTTGAPCTDANGIANIDPSMVQCDPQTGMCANGCDGLQDPSASGFLSPQLFATRDNFRQGTIDQLTLLRTIQEESMPGGALDFLDGTKVGYIGQSLGSITGGNLASYTNQGDLEAIALNVGGALLLVRCLNTVPTISAPLFAALAAAGVCEFNEMGNPASGCQDTPAWRQFQLIAQWILDPGDPLGTSIGVVGERMANPAPLGRDKVLMQMSRPDPVVPNITSGLLGIAYGMDVSFIPTANGISVDSNDTNFAVYDFSMLPQATVGSGCHGFILAPTCGTDLIDTLCNTLGAQQQAAVFVDTAGATLPAPRPAQVAGQACN